MALLYHGVHQPLDCEKSRISRVKTDVVTIRSVVKRILLTIPDRAGSDMPTTSQRARPCASQILGQPLSESGYGGLKDSQDCRGTLFFPSAPFAMPFLINSCHARPTLRPRHRSGFSLLLQLTALAGRGRCLASMLAYSCGAGFGGGRCGGCPPARGRAEGPTAQKGRSPWRRRGFADDSPEPP